MPFVETKARYKNTTMREIRDNTDELTGYDIAPIDGYVLHISYLDRHKYDRKTREKSEIIIYGYTSSSSSVEPGYDFDANPCDIYAIKRDAVGDDGVIY